MSYQWNPPHQPPAHQPAPPQVPVHIGAEEPLRPRWHALPMMAEIAPLGLRIRVEHGLGSITLPPGHYTIHFWSQYVLWRVGKASLNFDTTRGPVWLYYAAPHTIYSAGAAGFEPQQRPGRSGLYVIFGLALLVPLLVVLIALLTR
ncbi:hypothetical protein IU433_05390 [Nocardia puris]|nr:hypothetical protein [Nocardia puris]MBF6209614.1 hypothetical protein [Nocardia puris]MBF6366186.1 hypothetical protein [Nocardia puris]MBF6458475.1 hypothetical protein [Nocardia puris]